MTKYSILIVLFTFLWTCSYAQLPENKTKMQWYSFKKAIELNKENPRKIFIDVYTDWCGWCKKMDNSTFADPLIVEYMNENYYAVKFDAETMDTISFMGRNFVNIPSGRSRSSHQLAQSLLQGKMSYPSYAFMNEKNEILTVVKGYIKTADFYPIINFFGQDAFKTQKWEVFRKEFLLNNK